MGLLTNEETPCQSDDRDLESPRMRSPMRFRKSLDKEGPVYSMVYSKARGSESVVVQMTGMKGLMAGATGETIELPVKSRSRRGSMFSNISFRLTVPVRGMADTALRTATAGYLTRRLVDVGPGHHRAD